MAGEFCDYETKAWAEKVFKVPILNHWWQSETGHPITALCLGYGHHASLPKFSTGLPIPGWNSESFLSFSYLSKISLYMQIVFYLVIHNRLLLSSQFIIN